jgi:hypothetical protein
MPRKVFISYARDNRPEIDQLVGHLELLGDETWVDSALRGGQTWWDEILRRIKECDVFIAVVSHASLRSTACSRELDWAEGLGKAVLPVSLEPTGMALPRRILVRQIVDYSDSSTRDQAALRLAGAMASLGPARPLPRPLPEPPPVPLSYLADLIDQVTQAQPLSHDQQHQILTRLDQALHAADPEERRGGRETLERFCTRSDIYVDVYRRIEQLQGLENSGSGSEAPRKNEFANATAGHASRQPQPPRRSLFGNTNSLAAWALILSIICLGLGSAGGVVFGFMALKQINQTGENGRGLAISGIVIGGVGLVAFLIFCFMGASHPSASS